MSNPSLSRVWAPKGFSPQQWGAPLEKAPKDRQDYQFGLQCRLRDLIEREEDPQAVVDLVWEVSPEKGLDLTRDSPTTLASWLLSECLEGMWEGKSPLQEALRAVPKGSFHPAPDPEEYPLADWLEGVNSR